MLVLLAALSAVQVEGDARCPRPEDVSAALVDLLPASSRHDVASIGDGKVTLRDAAGTTVGERSLQGGKCDELARTAAVLIAAWEADVPSGAENPTLPAVVTKKDEPAPASPMAPPAPARPNAEIGVALGADYSSTASFVGWIYGGLTISDRWTGVAGVGLGPSASVPLPPGSVSWTRIPLALGARYTLVDRGFQLQVQPQVAVAALAIHASGFTNNGSAGSVDPGFRLAIRAVSPRWFPPLRFFAELAGAAWLFDQRGVVDNVGSVAVPRWEGAVLLGAAYENL